ncbi:MAG: hypothetical protein BGO96_03385 [Micrococcales bacterium 73-15]|uniref:hypothetical protein n=1 Tax=Salana multivorans TaxID=120377 RepID=UPI00095BBAAE|nr:hypothetical protein [Salana multivorans]OJX98250.1 MAG: hypothetical protein BGO96_03385 [Micrococcales bacterium 73-15]
MVRRVLGVLLVVLGAASIVLGVLSATSWRTSDTVTVTTPSADVPVVVVEPGVAGIVDRVVDLTVTAADPTQTVTIVTARDVDADGWIGDAGVQRVEDLADWTELVTTTTEGEQEVPDPAVSDMWLKVQQAEGSIELEDFRAPEDRTVLMVVRDGTDGPAPTVSFTWHRDVATPYLMPLVGAGIAAVVLGIGLVVSSFVGRPSRAARAAEKERRRQGAAGVAVDEDRDTVILSRVTDGDADAPVRTSIAEGAAAAEAAGEPGDPTPSTLTRRELRALRAQSQAADLEVIAAGIGPASDDLASPDAPEAYADWLRSEEGGEAGAAAAGAAGAASDVSRGEAWRRRWGVGPAEETDGDAGADDGDDAAGDDTDVEERAAVEASEAFDDAEAEADDAGTDDAEAEVSETEDAPEPPDGDSQEASSDVDEAGDAERDGDEHEQHGDEHGDEAHHEGGEER